MNINLPLWEKIPQIKVDANEWNVYQLSMRRAFDIALWIEDQPNHMWHRDKQGPVLRYRFSPEMESWFLLRWS